MRHLLRNQDFHYTKLCDSFKKFSRKHKSIFSRYGVNVKGHIHIRRHLPALINKMHVYESLYKEN